MTTPQSPLSQPSAPPTDFSAHILDLDQHINHFIDTHLGNDTLETILQGTLDIIQPYVGNHLVWLYCAAPRTFDGRSQSYAFYASSETPEALQPGLKGVVQDYCDTQVRTSPEATIVAPLETRLEASQVCGLPIFFGLDPLFLGIIGLTGPSVIGQEYRRLLQQAASRLDTFLYLKIIALEHRTVLAKVNQTLDQEGLDGLEEALLLLQEATRAPKIALLYLNDPVNAPMISKQRRVNLLYAVHGDIVPPPPSSFVLHEELGSNLIAYEGEVTDSPRAMVALGIMEPKEDTPLPFHCSPLEDRTCQPSQIIGKLFLIGRQLADHAELDLIEAVAMQVDTKISHYHSMKRTLSYALAPTQVEFFVRRPQIASWFFQTPHLEEVAMVYIDICGYTSITQKLNDPSITIEVAREWITREAQLVSQFGGYFDKEAGDCVICLFGPPFYELSLDTLVSVHECSELEALMREYPSDPERAAYRAVMFALASHDMIKEFQMGGTPLQVAIGIEVDRVAIGNLTGRLGSVTAMGNGMNMAARLQGFAGPGETIIGPNCRRRLEGYRRSNLRKELPFDIELGEEVALKGFERPVASSLITSR